MQSTDFPAGPAEDARVTEKVDNLPEILFKRLVPEAAPGINGPQRFVAANSANRVYAGIVRNRFAPTISFPPAPIPPRAAPMPDI